MEMKKTKTSNVYFTQDTENAIKEYNLTSDISIRNKIYEEKIHYAFFKLTQNIIHTFKFYHTDVENLEDLQHEIIIFLLSKIHLFNPDNGAKAYSYFGTIVKRWLITYDQKNYKTLKEISPISSIEDDSSHSYVIDSPKSTSILSNQDRLSIFTEKYIDYCTENIYDLFPPRVDKDNGEQDYEDAKIADAILELFRKKDSIKIFNKKALNINIKEIVDVKTSKIKKISDKMGKIYKENYFKYLETGQIKFPFPSIYNKK